MSEVKVNKISPRSGTAITLGDSGDTFTIPSGATLAIAGSVTGFTSAGIDDNATSVAITIDSSENVGIGSTTPSTDAWSGANSLVIKDTSGDNGLTIISSSTTNNGNIAFADSSGGSFSDIGGLITYLHNGDSFRFMTANAERMRLNSTALSIGTTSASGFDAGGLPLLVGNGSTHQGLTIYTGTSHTGAIHFADGTGTASYRGQINYRHDTDALQISVAGSERMRLTSTGLGIGSSAPTTPIHINSNTPIITFEETDQSNRKFQIGSFGNAYAIYDATNTQYRYILDNSGNHIFNEGGADCDFRVESDANTHALFVQGSSGNVGIGTTSPTGALEIKSAVNPQFKVATASAIADRNAGFLVTAVNSATPGGRSVKLSLDADGGDGSGTDNLTITKTGGSGDATITNESNANIVFGTNNAEKFRITSAGSVGIGETAPLGKLHVKSGDSGVSSPDITDLVVECSGSGGMSLLGATNGQVEIAFGDSGDANIGRIAYNHDNNFLATVVNANEVMRIDSSGNVGIGTSSPSEKLEVSGTVKATGFDGSTPIVYAQGNSGTSCADDTSTKITLDNELIDTQGLFANSRFTVTSGYEGKYLIIWQCSFNFSAQQKHLIATIKVSGTQVAYSQINSAKSSNHTVMARASIIKDLSTNDYVEFFGRQNSGGTISNNSNFYTNASIYKLMD